jgi:FkbM family methyltransferase
MITFLRKKAREFVDSFYQKDIPSKERIGGPNDFWTILTDHFSNKIIYSGGVGKDIGFEIQLVHRFGCQVFCFDPSPTGIATIKSLENKSPLLIFQPIGLSEVNSDTVKFSMPLNPEEGSFTILKSQSGQENEISFNCRKVSTLMQELGHSHIDIIKLDIEGFEYGVINDIIENNLSITQICIEFHDFFDNIPYSHTKNAVNLLKKSGYSMVHKTGSDYLFVKI